MCSNPELLHKEMDHLRKALTQCKNPKWALDKVEKRLNRPSREVIGGANKQGTAGAQPTTNEVKTKGHIGIPYTQGLCKSIKKIYGRYDIQTHFKGRGTIKNLLVSLKDKDPMVNKSRAICRNIGKFNLPHIWDRVLLNTPGLTLKRHAQAVGHANSNISYTI